MRREHIISALDKIRPALQAEGVAHLEVFGSQAREDSKPGSDLDILIDVFPRQKFSILDLVGIEQLVEEATGIPANAFMRRSLDDSFIRSISEDIVKVF